MRQYTETMGNNPSRNPFRRARLGLDRPTAEVDAYKARSVWGAWWDLPDETRARYFSGAEVRFVQRYGSRLDKIASMVEAPTTAAELHFYEVCVGNATSRNDTERLWLRVQLVCRYERSIALAARAEALEYELGPLQKENMALRRDLRDAELLAMEAIRELKMHTGEAQRPRPSICNVVHATMRFGMAPCSPWPPGSNLRRVAGMCR